MGSKGVLQLLRLNDQCYIYGGELVPKSSFKIWDSEITFGSSPVESISKRKCSHLNGVKSPIANVYVPSLVVENKEVNDTYYSSNEGVIKIWK